MNQQKVVKIYSTSTWPHCKRAKSFLVEKGIEFEEYDVRDDQNAREEMVRRSGQMGVPVIIIGDEIVVGFDIELLKEKLNEKWYKGLSLFDLR